MLRRLLLAVAALAFAPAAAGAVIGEDIVPYRDAADGVRVVDTASGKVVRFERTEAASAVWRKLSGRRAAVTCNTADGAMGSSDGPRERNRRVTLTTSAASDVCVISTTHAGAPPSASTTRTTTGTACGSSSR